MGEAFDVATGLPASEIRRRSAASLVELAQQYVAMKWPEQAANSRRSTVEALATACAVVRRRCAWSAGCRDCCVGCSPLTCCHRSAVAIHRRGRVRAVAWLAKASRGRSAISPRPAPRRELLDGLTNNLDGSTAAATVINRKRAVVHNLLAYAVERGMLAVNPMSHLSWKRPKRVEQVDPRVVINPRQARELFTLLTYVGRRNSDRGPHLVGFFAGDLLLGSPTGRDRPTSERPTASSRSGLGRADAVGVTPAAGSRWTDSGEVHDRRGLKHRAREGRAHRARSPGAGRAAACAHRALRSGR